MQNLEIIAVSTDQHRKAFLNLPYELYKNDEQWRAPLRFERQAHLNPAKNPTLKFVRDQKFLAKRGDKWVGRIAAFINKAHRSHHEDEAGHFGFFDVENDPEAGAALLKAAESWLVENGARKMIGPSNWSVNEETGLLVDGFDTPPVIMMPYGRPYYKGMIEGAGLTKATDMYAFQADLNAGYPRSRAVQMLVKIAEKDKRLTFRKVNLKKFEQEVALAMEIFNDAWSENWGFIPFSDNQIKHMAKEMKPLIQSDLFLFGMIDNEPVCFIVMIPDVNSAAHGLNGRLFPMGFAKLLYRLKVKGVPQARVPLMGLRRSWHKKRQGLAIVAHMCESVFGSARDHGFTHCELSWILEDNESMIGICEQVEAKRYKTYRMYEKNLLN